MLLHPAAPTCTTKMSNNSRGVTQSCIIMYTNTGLLSRPSGQIAKGPWSWTIRHAARIRQRVHQRQQCRLFADSCLASGLSRMPVRSRTCRGATHTWKIHVAWPCHHQRHRRLTFHRQRHRRNHRHRHWLVHRPRHRRRQWKRPFGRHRRRHRRSHRRSHRRRDRRNRRQMIMLLYR